MVLSLKFHKIFLGVAKIAKNIFPDLERQLKQANIQQDAIEYISKGFLFSFLIFLFSFFCMWLIFSYFKIENNLIILLISISTAVFSFIFVINYPMLIVRRRVRDIEMNLFFALQSMLMQISSGETIFNAMVNISSSDKYGELSKEFRRVVEDVRTGKPIITALEEMNFRNPSRYLNEALWHIINTIKTGANLKKNLESIVYSLSKEQSNIVRVFGSQLSLLSMAYMMIAIIFPSLGTTVLLIVSSVGGLQTGLSEIHFWGFLLATLIFQFFFITIIKSKRPGILGF
ncbi:MAG: type II secretion system F family protein [Candidatus Altiarchaeota archaeon]